MGNVFPGGGGLRGGHKQLKRCFTNHVLLFDTAVFLAQAVKALNFAFTVEDNDDGIGFGNDLFGKQQTL